MFNLTQPLCDLRHENPAFGAAIHTSRSSEYLLKYPQDELRPFTPRPIHPKRQEKS